MGRAVYGTSCPWGEMSMGRVVMGPAVMGRVSKGRVSKGRVSKGQVVRESSTWYLVLGGTVSDEIPSLINGRTGPSSTKCSIPLFPPFH